MKLTSAGLESPTSVDALTTMESKVINRDKYRACWEQYPDIPIFFQPWWLDAVCGELSWDVCLAYGKEKKLMGILVYQLRKKYGLTYIIQPIMTPYTGVWLNYDDNMPNHQKISFEKNILLNLIDQLPKSDFYSQRFYPSINNWLPFYWKGFKQTTHYTYIINSLANTKNVFNDFKKNQQKKIKKAQVSNLKVVKGSGLFNNFFELYVKTCKRNGIVTRSKNKIFKIHLEIIKQCSGEIYMVVDEINNFHAGVYVLWDNKTAYNWIPVTDAQYRKSGAMPFLIYEIIKDQNGYVEKYDMEGSMVISIEEFFSSFGTIQKPCSVISKYRNNYLEFLFLLYGKL